MPTRLFSLFAAGLLALTPLHAQTARPVFAYTSLADAEALDVVSRYFTERDYISVLLAQRIPELGERIPRLQQYKMVESLPKLCQFVEKGCQDKEAGLLIYDIESWAATPLEEQNDPVGSINRGAAITRQPGCQAFGVAPSRAYLSRHGDSACAAQMGPDVAYIHWENLDVLVIQAQGMMRPNCYDRFGTRNYERFVGSITRYARGRNPRLKVFAELSFRYASASQMAEVIDRLGGSVTGYYLALPSSMDNCRYCSATELESLLARYRQPRQGALPTTIRNRSQD